MCYIPDPSELLANVKEAQCDLVDVAGTYPCVYCDRRYPLDDMYPISAHPASPLECGLEDCGNASPQKHNGY